MTEPTTPAPNPDREQIGRWDLRFLELAEHIAAWSKDPSSKVGAVVARGKLVVSLGFNGFPAWVSDAAERYADRETKLRMVVHAEANALLNAQQSVRGCSLYVSRPPCASCAGLIIQAGIDRVVHREADADFAKRWEADMKAASTMFREAGVAAIAVPSDRKA